MGVGWVWDPGTGSHVPLVTGPRGGRLLLKRDCGLPCKHPVEAEASGGRRGFVPPEVLSWRVFLQLFLREGGSWPEARETRMSTLCVPPFSGPLGRGPWAGESRDTSTQLCLRCSSGEGGKPGAWVLCPEGPDPELCSRGELTWGLLGNIGAQGPAGL